MIRTTASVSGMICGMCETHVNDAVRNAFSVKKVSSSRSKGETVFESELPIDPEKLKQVVNATGYVVLSVRQEEMVQETPLKNVLFRLVRRRCKKQADQNRKDASYMTDTRRVTAGERLARQAGYFIREHSEQKFSLNEIAGALYVNGNYLSRVFKRETGHTLLPVIFGLD